MERKYQVFISSTFEDLKEERKEVIQALLEMDCIPTGMEMFQASDNSQWELIKNVISSCDYYIVIIAGRYCTIHETTKKSYTQMEYEYASSINIPIIAFLYKNPEDLPANKTEKSRKNQKKLEEFREFAKKKMVRYWTNSSELSSIVSRAMYATFRSHPRKGWIRNDDPIVGIDNALIKETIKQIQELNRQIKSNNNLEITKKEQCSIDYNKKNAEDFWNKYYVYKSSLSNSKKDKIIIDYKVCLGDFYLDIIKEIFNIILTPGIESFADFFKFILKPDFVKIYFESKKEDIMRIIQHNKSSYFSVFESDLFGCFCLNFCENLCNKITLLYGNYEKYNIGKEEFFNSVLFELGGIFTGNCLTRFSEIIYQNIFIKKYGFDKYIFENDFFEDNNQYLICQLSDSNKKGEMFINSYLILKVEYIKIIFDILGFYM